MYIQLAAKSLLMSIAVKENEITQYSNLTDMQVLNLLQLQRESLKTESNGPYCSREFECKELKRKQSKQTSKEIKMSYTDRMLSLIKSRPGKSRIYPEPEQLESNKTVNKKKKISKK